jgi:large subunit ribosomal protein L29
MDAKELRTLGVDELRARCRQWGEELFRARFQAQSGEAKDTSVFKKLKKDIARAQTVITEKTKGLVSRGVAEPQVDAKVLEDKPVKKMAPATKSGAKKSKEQGKG